MKENNIEAEATIEMSLRLLGGMEVNEQMDTHETKEDREKKRKLEEGKEGKATKPNDDMVYLKRDIMEALKRSDEKMDSYSRKTDEKVESYSRKTDEKIESYSKKTDERMDDVSRKADELLEKFKLVTNTVGSQIQGMNSSIVKMLEMNENMQEEGENKFNQFDERITNMERKVLDMDKKYEHRSENNKQEHNVNGNQGKTVITGHSAQLDLPELDRKIRVSQRTDCGKNMLKYQDVEDEVEEQMLKWQTKNSSQRL